MKTFDDAAAHLGLVDGLGLPRPSSLTPTSIDVCESTDVQQKLIMAVEAIDDGDEQAAGLKVCRGSGQRGGGEEGEEHQDLPVIPLILVILLKACQWPRRVCELSL